MKALVTGATGFIGSHLAEKLLSCGYEVSCLVRNPANLRYIAGLPIRVIRGDCTQSDGLGSAVKGQDFVFHLAGLTKAKNAADFHTINAVGTRLIVDAVLRENPGIRRFVHLSSLAAAGPGRTNNPIDETAEPAPVSVYGESKLAGERIVREVQTRMPVTIIRPPVVYGPRDGDMLVLFRMVKSGIIPIWKKCFYSFIHVSDLVTATILAAEKEEGEGEIFFVSDGTIYATDDILAAIAAVFGNKPRTLKVPGFLMELIGILAERVPGISIINSDKIRELRHTHWICSNEKARNRLHLRPEVTLEKGVRWTAEWYRNQRWL